MWCSTSGTLSTSEMADKELKGDLAKLERVFQEAKDDIDDFRVVDVVETRVPLVERDLDNITDQVVKFR